MANTPEQIQAAIDIVDRFVHSGVREEGTLAAWQLCRGELRRPTKRQSQQVPALANAALHAVAAREAAQRAADAIETAMSSSDERAARRDSTRLVMPDDKG